MLLLGRHALGDLAHTCTCLGGGGDPTIYMWGLRWWPHALTHGTNPLFTHLVWSPAGDNVAAATTIPLPSMLLWPLTAAFGAIPAYDALTLLSPAFAATAMYALCVRLTGRFAPALAAGWIYGFSSYELSQLLGHANLMLVALLPLAVLVALLRLDGRIGRRGYVAAACALIVAQLLTSSELLATSCAFAALALAVAWLVSAPAQRAAIARLALETAGAGLLAAVLTGPYLDYAIVRSRPHPQPSGATTLVTDLANLVVPTHVTLLRYAQGTAAKLPGNLAEQGGYLGAALIVAFCASLWERRRTAPAAVLAAVAAVALVLSFGSSLHVAGDSTVPLPWRAFAHVRIAEAVVPDRLILFVWFALAVAVAMWLAAPPRVARLRWAVVAVGILLVLPASATLSRPDVPALFSGSAYRRSVPGGGVVLALPYGYHGYGMLWQAEAGFSFAMASGYLSSVPPLRFRRDPTVRRLLANPPLPISPAELRALLLRYRVSTVLVDGQDPEGWPAELAAAGLVGRSELGTIAYRIPPLSGGAPR